ncbi:uncharacterized protein LOC111715857 [Eurytemora carolleeae]|uniref:uncharacterized protein LOC111715857 n=1 Tax=Eurytemora carolleeae TaxID=1294199 RepID=UPI000C772178|nr:uncharacterized protein LOC111715857 [Eurytemora carolleeae]|eukprot:XP_023347019.1 uncharacterized protein LOC111715857 [Eurytemora affinis]
MAPFNLKIGKGSPCTGSDGMDMKDCMGMLFSSLHGGSHVHSNHHNTHNLHWSAHTQAAVLSIGIVLIAYMFIVIWVVGKQFKKLDLGQEEECRRVLVTTPTSTDIKHIKDIEENKESVLI